MQIKRHNNNAPLPTLQPYTHSQKITIVKLLSDNQTTFQHATESLCREDTAICFEAMRRHRWLLEHHPEHSTNITISKLKEYATQIREEQQVTIIKGVATLANSLLKLVIFPS